MPRLSASIATLLLGSAVGLAVGWLLFARPGALASSDGVPGGTLPSEATGDAEQGRSAILAGAPRGDNSAAVSAGPSSTDGRAVPGLVAPPSSRALRARLRAAYRDLANGSEIAPDFLEQAELDAAEYFEATPKVLARRWFEREKQRAELGEIREPVELLFQVAGDGDVGLLNAHAQEREGRSGTPLDLAGSAQGKSRWHRAGGSLIPLGKVLVIERIELVANFGVGVAGYTDQGHVEFNLKRTSFRFRDGRKSLRGTLEGRTLVRPWGESEIRLHTRSTRASVRLTGRLLGAEAARGLVEVPFRLSAGERVGFLTGDRVRLQLAVGHVGGNPVTVNLLGHGDGRVESTSAHELWDESPPVASFQGAVAYAHGGGFVPPGQAFEVTSVRWRARLGREGSSVAIRIPGEMTVERTLAEGSTQQGTWNGSVRVGQGEEATVALVSSYFTLAEAVIEGRLVDLP